MDPVTCMKFAYVSLLASVIAYPAFAESSIDRPTLSVGDTWTYVVRSGETTFYPAVVHSDHTDTVLQVRADSYVFSRSTRSDSGAVTETKFSQSRDLNYLQGKGSGRREFKRLKWPLFIGSTWDAPAASDDQVVYHAEVKGWESISVPAGTFKALRIENWATWASNAAGSHGNKREIVWYAPEVKRIIRQEWKVNYRAYVTQDTVEELASFHLN